MSLTPTLNLHFDSNYSPPWYWMYVIIDSGSGYEPLTPHSPGTTPSVASPPTEFHVHVDVQNALGGSDSVLVDFGQLSADAENDEIHVHLIDSGDSEVGGGIIRLEHAQEGLRPLPSGLVS